jgi:general secretion pathway protein A
MYESFYGLKSRPFQLNPDPSFYFDSTVHHRAMAFVRYGLHKGEGFIIVTGEVGAGKTTLLRSMLGQLDSQEVVAAHLVSTQLDADDTLRMVAAAFGIRTRDMPKADLLLALEATLSAHATQGRRCLLVVDEAQNLSERAVEELRMLSNFQSGTHALLQTFLVGQPEFRIILQSPYMNQLRQRVIAACHIGPLNREETRSYIEHRLQRAGWKGSPTFGADAYDAIHAATGGIPRKVNLLCDRVLLSGFLSEQKIFDARIVHQVATEITGETGSVQSSAEIDAAGRHAPAGGAPARPSDLAEVRAAFERFGVVARPEPEGPRGGQLIEIRRQMKEFEATLHRLEQGDPDHVAAMRRLLDLMRKSLPAKDPEGRG